MICCQSLETPYQVRFSNGTVSAISDPAVESGGGGQGFRPHQLLEAAVGSCTAMVIGKYAKAHGIPLAGVAVTVTLDAGETDSATFVCAIEFSGELTDEQRRRMLRAARVCPVRKTLGKRLSFVDRT